MSADNPREPHTVPEPRRPAEPGTDTAPPREPPEAVGPEPLNSTTVGPELVAFTARLAAVAGAGPVGPGPDPSPAAPPAMPGYEVVGEIARGGMGVVYAARDLNLGREVAVKTVLPRLARNPRYTAQFDREARLTARLTHPGVPPAHALGTLADGRPFLAMKLIRGNTLAGELAVPDRAANLPRLLGVFERVCQTVGYAHSVGIIHRDLKPGNVMVGAFGEVQVMDWGLARHVRGAGPDEPAATGGGAGETVAGSAKGTPAYMPPEQARGEWDRVDARADVFALGGILYTTLTGEPPYSGDTPEEMLRQAAAGDLRSTGGRLDASGADAELVALCKRCLAADPADRPADGRAVAEAVAEYRAGVEERARRAEAERAAAEAKAAEEANTRREAEGRAAAEAEARRAAEAEAREQRKRRKVQLALAVAVGLLVLGGGAFAWWQDKQAADQRLRQERAEADRKATEARLEGERDEEARKKAEQARDEVRRSRALAADLRKQYKFELAERTLDRAAELARGGAPESLAGVEQARRDLGLVVELDRIRLDMSRWDPQKKSYEWASGPPAYRRAFAAAGLDPAAADAAALAPLIRASEVRRELLDGLDDWSLREPEPGLRGRLLAALRAADPDPWTDRLRDPGVRSDRTRLEQLAQDDGPGGPRPAQVIVLAQLLARAKGDPEPLLARALARHPDSFPLAFQLGLETMRKAPAASAGYFHAALAVRPDNLSSLYNLANALADSDQPVAARARYEEYVRRDPGYASGHYNFGLLLLRQRRFDEAATKFRDALRCDPGHLNARNNLGVALKSGGDVDGAVAVWKEAIALRPTHADFHYNLGVTYYQQGRYADAAACARAAVGADPKHSPAHKLLGELDRKKSGPPAGLSPVPAAPPPREVRP